MGQQVKEIVRLGASTEDFGVSIFGDHAGAWAF